MTSTIVFEDSPRARTTDPAQSHEAADRSQKTLPAIRRDVLDILSDGDELGGTRINAIHAWMVEHDEPGFKRCHPDSPRRRAGELARDGLLEIVGVDENAYGSNEAFYRITDAGRAALARAAA